MASYDPEFYEPPKSPPGYDEARPRQRGCFFYGCVIASVLTVLLIIMLAVLAFIGVRFFYGLVEQWTSPTPMELPKVQISEDQQKSVRERIQRVQGGGRRRNGGRSPGADQRGPQRADRGFSRIQGQGSTPGWRETSSRPRSASRSTTWRSSPLRGRFLNGEAELKASLSDGVLIVTLDSLEVNGKQLPERFLAELRAQNLAKDAYKNPRNAEMIRRFESIQIQDGKIILRPRAREKPPADAGKSRPPGSLAPPPGARGGPRRSTQGRGSSHQDIIGSESLKFLTTGCGVMASLVPRAVNRVDMCPRDEIHPVSPTWNRTTCTVSRGVPMKVPSHPRLAFLASALALALAWPCFPAGPERSLRRPRRWPRSRGSPSIDLANGLRVLLFPDASRPKVTVNLTVLVGSRHEGYGETGMAHLLEHMVFKGTPDHPDIPGAMKERGAQFNGSTSDDRTNYFETLSSSDENLEFAIKLEADRMVNSPIKGEDLATEFSVVRNEFEMGENSPEAVLSQRMAAVAYEWHNYGKSTIGNRSDIERVPVDSLRAFYKKFYQPDNAMLVVAGKFDEAKALEYINKYFGALPRPDRKLPATYTEEPPQDGERVVTLRRVGDVGLVGLLYHIPSATHPDYTAVQVLASILGSEPSGRLYKALVETKKAASVSARSQALHDPGMLEIMAEVNTKDLAALEKVRDVMYSVIDDVIRSGVTQEEVDRARQRMLKDRELAAADPNRIAVALSNWASQGDWRLYFINRDRLEEVTRGAGERGCRQLPDVQQSHRRLFHPQREARADARPPVARHRQAASRTTRAARCSRRASRSTSLPWPSRPGCRGPNRSKGSSSPSCPRRPAAMPFT